MPERGFATGYWTNPFVQVTPKDGKLLYLYLWTNDHCNPAGLYEITPATISFETGIPLGDIPKLFEALKPKVVWYPDSNLVWVKNFIKRQSKSPKFLAAAAKSLISINHNGAIEELLGYNLERYSVSIPYQYYIDRVSILTRESASVSESVSVKKIGVVKGEEKKNGEEIRPSESETEESLSEGDRGVISAWRSVKGFSMPIEEAAELVARLRTEFADVVDILAESKAWAARKLSEPLKASSRPSSQIWNWMRKAQEFARERGNSEQVKSHRVKGSRPASDFRSRKW